MLLFYGYKKVSESWEVVEENAPGYSRLYYIQGGDAYYKSTDEYRKLEKDKLYCFPNNIPYKITQDSANCLECLYLHVNISPYVISSLKEISILEHTVLKKLLEAFVVLCKEKQLSFDGSFQQMMTAATIEYLKNMKILETVDKKIEKSVLYMMEHMNESISVETLSNYCGYCPQHLIRLFKECMGLTPHQYIISCRMKNAVGMLGNGISVIKTAEAVGYKESKNFSRAFRQFYGISPSKVSKYLSDIM